MLFLWNLLIFTEYSFLVQFTYSSMNQVSGHTQTPSEQFWLALEGDNIFDMQTSMERWFQSHYRDPSIRVFWEEQVDQNYPKKRRTQDQEIQSDEKEYFDMEYEWFTVYGHSYTLLIHTEEENIKETIERDFQKYKPHIVKRIHDISIADTDALTGLCSAKIFFQKSKKLDENPDSRYAIVYFDINNLKGINNKYGHIGGDAYIKAFANVLKKTFRSHDYIVRKWWDEFVVIITNEHEYMETILAEKIKTVQREFSKQEISLTDHREIIKNGDTPPSASGGYSIKTEDMDVSFDKVLHWANRMADRKKGNEGKMTRFQEMIENTEDLGTIFEVAKWLNGRVLEIVQYNLSREIEKARRLVKRRIGRVIRAMGNR